MKESSQEIKQDYVFEIIKILAKQKSGENIPVTLYVFGAKIDIDKMIEVTKAGQDLAPFQHNIIFHRRGHEVREKDLADAREFVAIKYLGGKWPDDVKHVDTDSSKLEEKPQARALPNAGKSKEGFSR